MHRPLVLCLAVVMAATSAQAAEHSWLNGFCNIEAVRDVVSQTQILSMLISVMRTSGASLRRANLSQVNLDGANLRNADLSFTTLQGASLRGADLRGARLYGTDLRHADLSGAQLEQGSLDESHWEGARGINTGIRSHASLHNAGVEAAQAERWGDAERLFSEAIQSNPEEPLSWVARGISRGELGEMAKAANVLAYAGALGENNGDVTKAQQLTSASQRLRTNLEETEPDGNGVGSAILGGTLSIIQGLAPLALKTLMPLLP